MNDQTGELRSIQSDFFCSVPSLLTFFILTYAGREAFNPRYKNANPALVTIASSIQSASANNSKQHLTHS